MIKDGENVNGNGIPATDYCPLIIFTQAWQVEGMVICIIQ